jgi:hypothetical protein
MQQKQQRLSSRCGTPQALHATPHPRALCSLVPLVPTRTTLKDVQQTAMPRQPFLAHAASSRRLQHLPVLTHFKHIKTLRKVHHRS